ncbi:hypothetical protein GQ53DRAFT_824327 [Thozetella sp. PMI_491]|nr:hypothetical protein GQ53DRAFT_824327 [Thozetella sp. PMI_491]
MTDPFFAAHDDPDAKGFYPDFVATTMACIEAHRLCLGSSGACTEWGFEYRQVLQLLPNVDGVTLLYADTLQQMFLSVYTFLAMATGVLEMIPLRNMRAQDTVLGSPWGESMI